MALPPSDAPPKSALVLLDKFTYPPLPEITDDQLRETVFTHVSAVYTLSNGKTTGESYKKLAHIGDSLLSTFITCLLQARKPEAKPGAASDLRTKLVNGQVNTRISIAYGLPARVRTARVVHGTYGLSDIEHGEVWEAYIAGLFYSYVKQIESSVTGSSQGDLQGQFKPSSGGGIMDEMVSHGQAFGRLGAFLAKLHTPLAEALYDPYLNMLEDLAEHSTGCKSELYAYTGKLHLSPPVYSNPPQRIWPYWINEQDRKGTHGMVFGTTCSITLRDGTVISHQGINRDSRKAGDIAALMVLRELGMH
ncbi:hypothetical protein IAU60_006275 [Kwoniella sp. DSM 27419]